MYFNPHVTEKIFSTPDCDLISLFMLGKRDDFVLEEIAHLSLQKASPYIQVCTLFEPSDPFLHPAFESVRHTTDYRETT
jgi:hypothetical protein